MAYASIAGKARTSARNPQAHAICDRCGGRYNHVDLQWQNEWAGATVMNKRLLVCRNCLDTMQPQLRSIILPGDPPPIINPRPEAFDALATDYRVTQPSGAVSTQTGLLVPGNLRDTEDGDDRITES